MSDIPSERLRLRYTDPDGELTELVLADKPVTIGRSPEAEIVTLDERASRMHCGIRIWDGEYYVKDLKSKNGTFLNNQRVEMAKVKPGDKIRLGNTIITVDDKKSPGTSTTIDSIEDEMSEGKGYKTILREIVENSGGSSGTEVTRKPAPGKPVIKAKPVAVAPEIKSGDGIELDQDVTQLEEEPKRKTARLAEDGDLDGSKVVVRKDSKVSVAPGSKVVRRKPTAIKIKRNS